jgi:hypothetical protein
MANGQPGKARRQRKQIAGVADLSRAKCRSDRVKESLKMQTNELNLTKTQENISAAQSIKMDFVIGDFITLLIENGMEEREAARYVSSILINAGIGMLRDFLRVTDQHLEEYLRLVILNMPLKSHEQIET